MGLHHWQSWQEQHADAAAVLADKATLMAAHTERTLFGVERTLDEIIEMLAVHPEAKVDNAPGFHAYLKRQLAANPTLMDLVVTDANGQIRHWSADGPPIDISKRAYFLQARANPDSPLTISPTERSIVHDGRWFFALSKPLRGPDGQFVGIVTAIIDADYFRDLYASLRGEPGASLVLMDDTGHIMVRVPNMDSSVGKVVAAETFVVQPGQTSGISIVTSPIDGQRRMTVAHRLEHLPLISSATAPYGEILRRWREDMTMDVTLALLSSLAVAAVGAALAGQIRRLSLAEAALREERDLSIRIVDSLPGIFYAIDTEGKLSLWNRNLESVSGWGFDELRGRDFGSLFRIEADNALPDQHPALSAWVQSLFQQGHGELEADLLLQNGETRPHYLTGTLCRIDGEMRGIGLALDISSIKTLEATLRRSNADLQQFVYIASHDLQGPLRTITSYLQLLLRRHGDRLNDEAREFIDFAGGAAKRLTQLVTDLLAYSRMTTRDPRIEAIDLAQVVAQVERALAGPLQDSNASLQVMGPLPVIQADPHHMSSLFQNLIDNAVKYRAPDRPPVIRISAQAGPEGWEFAIADNGIGIAPNDRERIFAIFQRLHGSDVYGGTGVGLALCKAVVERHHGRIWVESEEGQGTVFRFILRDL